MTRVQSLLRINPIIVKELRSRMRGGRAFITLTISLLLIAGVMYGVLQLLLAMSTYQTDILSPRIGQSMFAALAFLELALVCGITPAVTSGAISGEREKQTYEMLQATPLSPSRVLWGKLISALSYIFLLLFAGIPLASLVFIFGGVALRDMARVLLVLVVLAVSFGVLGLFMSALFKRTGRATVASYAVVVVLVFVPMFVAVAISVARQAEPPRWLLAPSPLSLISSVMGGSITSSPLSQVIPILGGYWIQSAISPVSQNGIPRPLYHYGLPFYAGLTLILYLLTTRLIQPSRRWKLSRKAMLVWAGIILGFALLLAGLYFSTASRYEWVKPPAGQPTPVPGIMPLPAGGGGGGGVFMSEPAMPAAAPTSVLPGVAELEPKDQADVYALGIRNAFASIYTKGSGKTVDVYLASSTEPCLVQPCDQAGDAVEISDEVKKAVVNQINDLPASLSWLPANQTPAVEAKTGQYSGGALLVTLGNIYTAENGAVMVPVSIQTGEGPGTVTRYTFSYVNGVWGLVTPGG